MASRSVPLNGPVLDSLMGTPSFLIAWLFDRFFDDYVRTVAELELRPAEHSILLTVAELQPLRQARLAERIRLDHATFVTTVNALERRGLLRRERDPADRRTLLVRLSPAGRRLNDRAAKAVAALEVSSYEALDADELRALTGLLNKIVRGVDA